MKKICTILVLSRSHPRTLEDILDSWMETSRWIWTLGLKKLNTREALCKNWRLWIHWNLQSVLQEVLEDILDSLNEVLMTLDVKIYITKHPGSFVQDFRPLGAVQAYNLYIMLDVWVGGWVSLSHFFSMGHWSHTKLWLDQCCWGMHKALRQQHRNASS